MAARRALRSPARRPLVAALFPAPPPPAAPALSCAVLAPAVGLPLLSGVPLLGLGWRSLPSVSVAAWRRALRSAALSRVALLGASAGAALRGASLARLRSFSASLRSPRRRSACAPRASLRRYAPSVAPSLPWRPCRALPPLIAPWGWARPHSGVRRPLASLARPPVGGSLSVRSPPSRCRSRVVRSCCPVMLSSACCRSV